MYINTFKYTPKDVSCQLCTEYVKKLGCTALRCPWLADRIEAGVVGYREAVLETFPHERRLFQRLNLLIKHYPGSLWSNEQHERRMQYQCAVQGYRRRRDIRMSEVDTQAVEWLWKPYIPFGKVTIVQGNPGEGKTTFALRLAAACTTGRELPTGQPLPPFNVIYQTAEDGLGDTVKPRLIEAAADLDRVLVIDEAKRELSLSDERIEKAIMQTGARLIILDPIGALVDCQMAAVVVGNAGGVRTAIFTGDGQCGD